MVHVPVPWSMRNVIVQFNIAQLHCKWTMEQEHGPFNNLLLNPKQPHRASLGNLRKLTRKDAIQCALHAGRVSAPAGQDGDVLFSIYSKCRRRRQYPRVGGKLPEQLTCRCIERMKFAVAGSATEHKTSA